MTRVTTPTTRTRATRHADLRDDPHRQDHHDGCRGPGHHQQHQGCHQGQRGHPEETAAPDLQRQPAGGWLQSLGLRHPEGVHTAPHDDHQGWWQEGEAGQDGEPHQQRREGPDEQLREGQEHVHLDHHGDCQPHRERHPRQHRQDRQSSFPEGGHEGDVQAPFQRDPGQFAPQLECPQGNPQDRRTRGCDLHPGLAEHRSCEAGPGNSREHTLLCRRADLHQGVLRQEVRLEEVRA